MRTRSDLAAQAIDAIRKGGITDGLEVVLAEYAQLQLSSLDTLHSIQRAVRFQLRRNVDPDHGIFLVWLDSVVAQALTEYQ